MNSQQNKDTTCTLSIKNLISRTCCVCFGRRHGNYLVALYMFVKILFIANVIGQLFMLNNFLDMNFHVYGFEVIRAMINGENWTQSQRFPRVTMCDLKIRRLGNIQRYTVQCVLPINLFNEAIFLFIWFWMVLVAALAVFTLFSWGIKSFMASDRLRFIKKHLILMNRVEEKDPDQNVEPIGEGAQTGNDDDVRHFVEDYLKQDGVFVMRLVGHNTNAITVTEYICRLWDEYIERAKKD